MQDVLRAKLSLATGTPCLSLLAMALCFTAHQLSAVKDPCIHPGFKAKDCLSSQSVLR